VGEDRNELTNRIWFCQVRRGQTAIGVANGRLFADDVCVYGASDRSGALTAGDGLCLGVDTAKVGAGGLIGQQGAHLQIEPCAPFAPEQTFSAPHPRPPAA
jgi:hypothetical protein